MDLITKALDLKQKYRTLIDNTGKAHGAISKVAKVSRMSPDTVKKYLRLLDLPSEIQLNIQAGKIKLAEALIISRLPADRQVEIAEYYLNRKLNRKRLTEIVNAILDGRPEQTKLTKIDINIRKELERLIESLGFYIDENLTDESTAVIKTWDEDLVKHLFLVRSSTDSIDHSLDISIPSNGRINRDGIKLTINLIGLPKQDDLAVLICHLFRRIEVLRNKLLMSKKKP